MSELKDALINISEEVRTKVIPENIKAGTKIFNVEGMLKDSYDADATAGDILAGKTAYVGNEKIEGTMTPFDTSDATAKAANIDEGVVAYGKNNTKIVGTGPLLDKNAKPIMMSYPNMGSLVNIETTIPLANGIVGTSGKVIEFPVSKLPISVSGKNIVLRVIPDYLNRSTDTWTYFLAELCVTEMENIFKLGRDSSKDPIYCYDSSGSRIYFQCYTIFLANTTLDQITASSWQDVGMQWYYGSKTTSNQWYRYTSKDMQSSGGLSGGSPYKGRKDDCIIKTKLSSSYSEVLDYKLKANGVIYTYVPNATLASKIGLKAANIKKGTTYLGVEGSLEELDTSDADATAQDILKDKTAYVNGEKVVGELEISSGESEHNTKIEMLEANTGTISLYTYFVNSIKEISNVKIGLGGFHAFENLKGLEKAFNIDLTGTVNTQAFFANCVKLKEIGPMNTSTVNYMESMFYNCQELEEIPDMDTGAVTSMEKMFTNCYKIKTIPSFNTSKVTNMKQMLYGCKALTEVPFMDTGLVTDMSLMLQSTLISVCPDFNTENVTAMNEMFRYCTNLKNAPNFNTSNVTNMSTMFGGCSALESVPLYNTSKVTNFSTMFDSCKLLKQVPLFDMSSATATSSMFYGCKALEEIPLFNISNATNTMSMFNNCSLITEVPLLNTEKVTSMASMFNSCTNLTTVPILNTSAVKTSGMQNIFSGCPNLSDESLNNIMQMCINATLITSSTYKKLKYIGLTSDQVTRCQSLSNYEALVAAGWTTGY